MPNPQSAGRPVLPTDARRIIELLDLKPLPGEGGFFRETYRAGERIPSVALPARYSGNECGRSHSTQIYFLLTTSTPSLLHVVQSDEVFHHYAGDSVEQLHLFPDGTAQVAMIGCEFEAGGRPQIVVPRGVWQGCRVRPGDSGCGWALLGCTVSPGFDWADFRLGSRAEILEICPRPDSRAADLIQALTPEPTQERAS